MKPGDLVRYKIFPHSELHDSGCTGIVLTSPAAVPNYCDGDGLETVDVMWSTRVHRDGEISWDYVDEIEVVSEDR